jgi:hypothetical protein
MQFAYVVFREEGYAFSLTGDLRYQTLLLEALQCLPERSAAYLHLLSNDALDKPSSRSEFTREDRLT